MKGEFKAELKMRMYKVVTVFIPSHKSGQIIIHVQGVDKYSHYNPLLSLGYFCPISHIWIKTEQKMSLASRHFIYTITGIHLSRNTN